MLCAEASLVKHKTGSIEVQPLYCRSWGCDICAPRRKKQLVAIAMAGIPDTFVTLTVNPAMFSGPDERARRLSDAWKRLKRAACRKYGYKQIPYLAVFEKTERGEPHLHILARCKWIDQAWMSEKMREFIGAPIVDIRRVKSVRQAANYVAKYMAKDPHKFKGVKRYFRTTDYELPAGGPDEEKAGEEARWHVVMQDAYSYVRQSMALGFGVSQDGDRWILRWRASGPAG